MPRKTAFDHRQRQLMRSYAHLFATTAQVVTGTKRVVARGPNWLPSSAALKNGLHILGGPGSGKSRIMGRAIALQAFLQHAPLVILDPIGGTIDNFLDRLMRLSIVLPPAYRPLLWERIRYVDVASKDYVAATPLYSRQQEDESFTETADRFPAVVLTLDPFMETAPVMGANSFLECARHGGQIAAALGLQLDFISDLVKHPGQYKVVLTQALKDHPELSEAVDYFRLLMEPKNPGMRERKTGSFLNKIHPFLSSAAMKAAFCAPTRGIDWSEVVRKQEIVLIDFRNEWDEMQRRFKLLWWLKDFIAFAKGRNMAGRGQEIMLMIDEITQLLGYQSVSGVSPLAADIEELTSVLGRNYGVNVVIAHQNLRQVDERIADALMQMGSQMIGHVAHPDDALLLARYFLHYDPEKIKKIEKIHMSLPSPDPEHVEVSHSSTTAASSSSSRSVGWRSETIGDSSSESHSTTTHVRRAMTPQVIDYRTTEFTPEEQFLMLADKFRSLGQGEFMSRLASGEGNITGELTYIRTAELDAGQYPNAAKLAHLYPELRRRSGAAADDVLAAIENARPATPISSSPAPTRKPRRQTNGAGKPAILPVNGGAAHDQSNGNLSPIPPAEEINFWFKDE